MRKVHCYNINSAKTKCGKWLIGINAVKEKLWYCVLRKHRCRLCDRKDNEQK